MQKLEFSEAVSVLTDADPRYHEDAYFFLRDGMDLAMKARQRRQGQAGHVTGQQICEGLRQLAIKAYGPMVPTVFEYWGLRKTEDFGEMVWNLIDLNVFGRTESDSRADFKNVFSFREAFVDPFLPRPAQRAERKAKPGAEVRN